MENKSLGFEESVALVIDNTSLRLPNKYRGELKDRDAYMIFEDENSLSGDSFSYEVYILREEISDDFKEWLSNQDDEWFGYSGQEELGNRLDVIKYFVSEQS